jgi:DNA-directed RNA polymerase specialized sigma24 family protein
MEDRLQWDDVYRLLDEAKAMARGLLRRERGASLQTTALVLSALRRQRYADQDWSQVTWPNRRYFFGALYRAMERVVLDHARSRARRREIPVRPEDLEFDALPQTLGREPAQVVALLEALAALRQTHPQWVEAIEHRYYGGLTLEETAQMMDVDERTLRRWWDRGRLVLAQDILVRMNADPAGESPP